MKVTFPGICGAVQAAGAAGELLLPGRTPTLFLCHLPSEPEMMAAVWAEARIHYAGRALIPDPFSPYTLQGRRPWTT